MPSPRPHRPTTDGREPSAAVPCGNYRHVIDALDTKYPDPEHVEAVGHMCAGCPIQPKCHDTHAHEQWLVNVQRGARKPKPPRPRGWVERATARAQTLEAFIADGLTRTEAARQLGITVGSLENWCYRWRAAHLWHGLREAA